MRATGLGSSSATVKNDPLLTQARGAFANPTTWGAFDASARARFAGTSSLTVGWLGEFSADVIDQLEAADDRPGRQSTGPLENIIDRNRKRVAGRAQTLRNPDRTQRMLDLLTAGLANDVTINVWADRIYPHLAANERRPAHKQRPVTGRTM